MARVKLVTESINFWRGLFFVALGIFAVLSLSRTHQIVADDDLWTLLAAKTLYATGMPQIFRAAEPQAFYQHPYLYYHLIAGMFKVFGPNEFAARLVGIISGLVSIILVFLIVKLSYPAKLYERTRLAAIVSALYALAPTTIQGSAIMQIDNTILAPAVLFIFWSSIKYFQQKRLIWLCLVSFFVALSFWMRISTPLILILIMMACMLLSRNKARMKFIFIVALLAGVAIFILSWYAYCKTRGAPFLGTFNYTFHVAGLAHRQLSITHVLENLVYLALWLGIFTLPTVIFILSQKKEYLFRDLQISHHFIFFSSIILIAGYSILGGMQFGYPRYQSPAIPLLYIAGSLILSKKDFEGLQFKRTAIFLLFTFIIQLFVIGDLLYILRYVLRDYSAFMSGTSLVLLKSAFFRVMIACVIYIILFTLALRLFPRKSILGLLVVFSVISAITLTFLQSVANYNTGYNYGERGMPQAAGYIRAKIAPETAVIAPGEVIYHLQLSNQAYLYPSFWRDDDEIRRKLEDPKVSAFVYSIVTNTADQIKNISKDAMIQKLLRENFKYITIGSYHIWARNK